MKSQFFHIFQRLFMRRQVFRTVILLDVEDKDIELAIPGDPGIFLAKGAGRRIARIAEGLLAPLFLLFDKVQKDLPRHIDLSTDLEKGDGRVNGAGNGADGLEVFGNILSGIAISAGRAAGQDPVRILQRDGEAVDFGFHDKRGLRFQFPDPGRVVIQRPIGKGVLKAFHPDAVRNRTEAGARHSPDMLRRRVGADKVRKVVFQCFQLVHEHVILVVVDCGRILIIVEVAVVL